MALVEKNQRPAEDKAPAPVVEAPPQDKPPAPARAQQEQAERTGAGDEGGGRGARAGKRRPLVIALIVLVLIGAAGGGAWWWLYARQFETTDDAYIAARTVSVSPQVAGAIVAVPVTDNQHVAAGAVLVRIDPRDYRAALAKAEAQLAEANANIANLRAQIAAQEARIDQAQKQAAEAQAALQFSSQQNTRYQTLLKRGAGTEQQAQQSSSDLTQKQAAYAGAQAAITAAQKQLVVLQTQQQSAGAEVDAARATRDQAETNLTRTTVVAPAGGHIANLTAAEGNYAQPGEALMALVPDDVWVTANFKETALAHMRVGQPVTISVDAYPGRTFHGHVASIQAGSGAAFSLLPPENATGNFVKVVQRVPVKIVFDRKPDVYLGPGMSVEPSVKVR